MSASILPIAARIGFTHVSVAQLSSGRWHAVLWSADRGPTPLGGNGLYESAVEQAETWAARNPASVLDLPSDCGVIDVLRTDGGDFMVQQMSASGSTAANLGTFGPHEREQAVSFAMRSLGQYAPCRLGRVDL